MKILIFSDSHGNVEYMRKAVEQEKPERVFHLGDVVRDGEKLQAMFPELPMDRVRGNCDFDDTLPEEREVLLGGKRFWLLHGHTYRVKWGYGPLMSEARARGVDGVFFGHTHQPLCQFDGRLWTVNPGSCKGYPMPTCAVAELDGDGLRCRILELR